MKTATSKKASTVTSSAAPVVTDTATAPATTKAKKEPKAPAAPKEKRVTNTDKARVIWLEELTKRQAGVYNTADIKFPNRAFRRVVLDRFVAEVEGKDGFISMASASTIFNNFKDESEKVEGALHVNGKHIGLGRDPKIVVVKQPKAPKASKPEAAPAASAAETSEKVTV